MRNVGTAFDKEVNTNNSLHSVYTQRYTHNYFCIAFAFYAVQRELSYQLVNLDIPVTAQAETPCRLLVTCQSVRPRTRVTTIVKGLSHLQYSLSFRASSDTRLPSLRRQRNSDRLVVTVCFYVRGAVIGLWVKLIFAVEFGCFRQ